MSQENVEIVQRGLTATLEEDWATARETLHQDVEVHDFDIPDAGVYHGTRGSWRGWSGGAKVGTNGASRTSRFVQLEMTR